MHVVRVPSLRERREDIGPLAERFLESTCREYGRKPMRYSPEVLRRLERHDFARNNVRELRNTVARMVIVCDGDEVLPEHLPSEFAAAPVPSRLSEAMESAAAPSAVAGDTTSAPDPVDSRPDLGTLKELRDKAERDIIRLALERNGWRIKKTAEELGLSDHASLLRVMRRHGIRRRDDKGSCPASQVG